IPAAPHETPRLLAGRIRDRLGGAGDALSSMLESLEAQRYSRVSATRPDGALTRAFAKESRRLRGMRASTAST
ncbi:MAG: DUF3488 domain-containing protein, partial [Burkholderiaceae bacterium]